MKTKRINQNGRRATLFLVSLLVLSILGGCGSSGPSFKDVQDGTIPLDTVEKEAVKELLTSAGIEPQNCPVLTEQTVYDNKYVSHKILIENGHVTALQLRETELRLMDAVEPLVELRDLDLCFNQITELKGLREAVKLESLSLVNNDIKNVDLEGCSALKVLDLCNNEITVLPDISHMPGLETLKLRFNGIESAAGLRGGEKLGHLDISYNQLTSAAGISNLPNLFYLGLEGNKLTTLEGLEELPKLRTLMVSRNKLKSVEPLTAFPALESVDLRTNEIETLPKFPRKIARLQIEENPVAAALKEKPKVKPVWEVNRCEALPEIDGSLTGGGMFRYKMTKTSRLPFSTPSSFRFTKSDMSLTKTAGFGFVPIKVEIKEARVTVYVKKGRVRVYLKDPGDYKYVDDKYGKNRLQHFHNDLFVYSTSSPGRPSTVVGILLSPRYAKYDVLLEALDGSAEGVSYVITDTKQLD
jgi:protein phosphatase 1 regulatory subunit 7